MKRCAAKPYDGEEKYIFVSYCHKDRAYVFPVIEQLAKDGYRVWYDEGIDPGSEWPETIARHLNGSAICIAFITANSLNSHNCRREINFALLKKKHFISILLEPVQMSLGMEMQLSSSQSIFKYTLSSENEFFSKLRESKNLEYCKGSPDFSIEVSTPKDYQDEIGEFGQVREAFCDQWFVQDAPTPADDECDWVKSIINEAADGIKLFEDEIDKDATQVRTKLSESSVHMLKRDKTGEAIRITKSPFNIGRSNDADDYVITDNRSISRSHATLIIKDDICYIVDNNSLNQTFVNGTVISPQTEQALSSGDNVRLYNERFVYLKYNN